MNKEQTAPPDMIKHAYKLKLNRIYNKSIDVRNFVLNTSEEEQQKVFSAMLKNDMYYLKLRGFNIKMAAISIYNNLQEHKNLDFKDDYSVLLIQLYENYLKGIEADEEKDEVRIYPKNKYSTGYIINEPLAYNVLEHEINVVLPQEIETFENIKRGDTESRKQLNGQFLKIKDLFNRLYNECLYKVSQTKDEDLHQHRHFFELMNHKINFFNKHGYYWEYCKPETYIENFYRIKYPELKEEMPEATETYFIQEIINSKKERFKTNYKFSTNTLMIDFSFCEEANVFHRLKLLNKNIIEALKKEFNISPNKDSADLKKFTKQLEKVINIHISKPNKIDFKHPTPPPETKEDKLKANLIQYGFFEIEKVKRLSDENKDKLIQLIVSEKMPYGIAMFEEINFCDYLDLLHGTKYKTNLIISKWYNPNAKDGTTAKHQRNALNKKEPNKRYTSYLHKERVKKDYESLK